MLSAFSELNEMQSGLLPQKNIIWFLSKNRSRIVLHGIGEIQYQPYYVKFEHYIDLQLVWPEGYILCSKFGYLQQWKFAQYHKRFVKVISKFVKFG